VKTELLAQLIDMTAIRASEMKLTLTGGQPPKVERPEFLTRPAATTGDRSAELARAVGVLKGSARG
jgi:hypothetical protein